MVIQVLNSKLRITLRVWVYCFEPFLIWIFNKIRNFYLIAWLDCRFRIELPFLAYWACSGFSGVDFKIIIMLLLNQDKFGLICAIDKHTKISVKILVEIRISADIHSKGQISVDRYIGPSLMHITSNRLFYCGNNKNQ